MTSPAFYARMSTFGRVMYLVFVVGPVSGFLCGLVTAVVGFTVTLIYQGEPQAIPASIMLLGVPSALIFGCIFGFGCMVFAAWSLRNEDLYVALRYLVIGTLLFALIAACIPGGVGISPFAGLLGFWVGFVRFKIRNFTKDDWRRFVFGESGRGW